MARSDNLSWVATAQVTAARALAASAEAKAAAASATAAEDVRRSEAAAANSAQSGARADARAEQLERALLQTRDVVAQLRQAREQQHAREHDELQLARIAAVQQQEQQQPQLEHARDQRRLAEEQLQQQQVALPWLHVRQIFPDSDQDWAFYACGIEFLIAISVPLTEVCQNVLYAPVTSHMVRILSLAFFTLVGTLSLVCAVPLCMDHVLVQLALVGSFLRNCCVPDSIKFCPVVSLYPPPVPLSQGIRAHDQVLSRYS